MRCEVVAVGTELLLGQIIDSNSSWIGEQLALVGINSHFQTKVGDNLERMISCIEIALSRSEAVITCGGLGPTQDDITREAIAAIMGVELVRDDGMSQKIRELFTSRRRTMTENNLQQADLPVGASFIPEMPGTAPGLICPVGDKVIYAVPGVPFEMRTMMEGTILPDLQRRAGVSAVIKSRVLKTWGHTESGLAEMLHDRIEELDEIGNPTLAFQASGIEGLKVRITAKAEDDDTALKILEDEDTRVRAAIGDVVFGVNDETMESVVLGMLKQRGLKLAIAESLTGGLVANRMTAVPSAREVLSGAVAFPPDAESFDMLGVANGYSLGPDVAETMAEGARKMLGADIGIATIGVPGPDPINGHKRGTVFLGISFNGKTESHEVRLPGDRNRVRQYAVISLLNMVRRRLLSLPATQL